MTEEYKKKVRQIVNGQRGWIPIWGASEMPCEYLDEEVELIYEDMDGYPQLCDATYTYNRDDDFYHRPYFKRDRDGARMCQCLAWRKKQ